MTSAWRRLCGLEAYQITEIPRPDEEAANRDPGRVQRAAALVAAYHAGQTVAFGWLRERAGEPVRVLAAGPGLAGSVSGADVVLALPGGARGRVLGPGAVAAAGGGLACWRAGGRRARGGGIERGRRGRRACCRPGTVRSAGSWWPSRWHPGSCWGWP